MAGKRPWGEREIRPAVGRGLGAAIFGFLGVGAVAGLYVIGLAACKPPTSGGGLAEAARGSMAKLKVVNPPTDAPKTSFTDADGKPVTLADFKGQAVVVNLWATWCAPCVKEMPTLARLQADFAGRPVKVVALSEDADPQVDKAKAFIADHSPLAFYHDKDLGFTAAVTPQVQGFPTTLLFDKAGRLRGVVQGEADWSSPEAQNAVAALMGS